MSRTSAFACFRRGLALSLSKPYLAAALWLIQLLLASVVILPVSNSLHEMMDRSPAADQMVANPDFGWFETVRRTHPDLLGNFPDLAEGLLTTGGVKSSSIGDSKGVGAVAISLGFLAIVLHAFALGGVFGTLREPSGNLVTFGREGMRRLPAFLLFTLGAFAAAVATYRWVYLETGEALHATVMDLETERQALIVTGLRLTALLLSLSAIKLLADSVRAIWVARPDLPAVSRFFTGVGGFLTRLPRLFGVFAVSMLLTAGLYLLWLVLDPSAGGEARFALVPLILSQQVFVFVRCLIKVGYYAGISEALTRTHSPEYAYAPASLAAS
ncbi:MAG: hypothetical protein ACRD00_08530 [Thermoanaerobaculia bacterium]